MRDVVSNGDYEAMIKTVPNKGMQPKGGNAERAGTQRACTCTSVHSSSHRLMAIDLDSY